jgi:peptide/nickel transport system substrate-binding protein
VKTNTKPYLNPLIDPPDIRNDLETLMQDIRKTVVIIGLILAIGGCPVAGVKAEATIGDELIHLYQRFPAHLNGAIRALPEISLPAANIFVFLVKMNRLQEPRPYLAESWTISDDGLVYTFRLKPGTVFHDGTPVTADDVAFSIRTVRHYHPFGDRMFGPISTIETPDETTIVIRLQHRHPALMQSLALPLTPILPRHVYSRGPIRKNPANRLAIGSGPFRVVDFQPGQRFVLERFENFLIPDRPYLKRYIGVKADTATDIVDAMRKGQAHLISFVGDPEILKPLQLESQLDITATGYEGFGAVNQLAFNLRKPMFKDPRVRRAIAEVIDPVYITNVLHEGFSRIAYGPFRSDDPFYGFAFDPYPYDPDNAIRLLEAAGWHRKADGIRFTTRLTWMPDDPVNQERLARYLQSQLRRIDIEVELDPPGHLADWTVAMAKWDFDLSLSVIFAWGDPAIGLHSLFSSSTIEHRPWANTSGFIDETTDALLETAASETLFLIRDDAYTELQNIIREQLPAVFTHEVPFYTVRQRTVDGLPSDDWGALGPFDGVRLRVPIERWMPPDDRSRWSQPEPTIVPEPSPIILEGDDW